MTDETRWDEANKLWDAFLNKFPAEKIESMTLAEYTAFTAESDAGSFTYWLEHRLMDLGSIRGGSSLKFGVWRTDEKSKLTNTKNDGGYAWHTKYGASSPQEAFETIKQRIKATIEAVQRADLSAIESIGLPDSLKWKVAFMYQDRAQPCVLNVFTPDALRLYLGTFDKKSSVADLQKEVMARRENKALFAFGREVWGVWSEDVMRHFQVKPKINKDFDPISKTWDENKAAFFTHVVSAFNQCGFDWYFIRPKKSTPYTLRVARKKPKKEKDKKIAPKATGVLGFFDFQNCKFLSDGVAFGTEDLDGFNGWFEGAFADEKGKEIDANTVGNWPDAYDEAEEEPDDEGETNAAHEEATHMKTEIPLNQILYGPPGTGKTYHTIDKALEIFGERNSVSDYSSAEEARRANKKLFDERVSNGDIQFVTFHQSFSYEDFVEGLTAQVNEQTQQIRYEVSDGVFKRMCESAAVKIEGGEVDFSHLKDQRVWKMSLGAANEGTEVYDACLKSNRILLGWGGDIDFSQCKNRNDIKSQYQQSEEHLADNSYAITAVNAFLLKVKKDDLIVVSDGNRKFRAIARVTGDYECLSEGVCEYYFQSRAVEWLREYKPSLPRDRLMDVDFSQMTIYEPSAIDRKKLEGLLSKQTSKSERSPKVLIIDEINRGNISKIFGELITLIEPSKRQGADEALSVTLPYSKTSFGVPDNVYIIGTMNSADRSLASLDLALRRRFYFIEMPPDASTLAGIVVDGIEVQQMFEAINQRIEVLLGRDYCIGHAYFLPLKDEPNLTHLAAIFKNKIIPLLQEYFFEDWERIAQVLNSDSKEGFVVKKTYPTDLFGSDPQPENTQNKEVWRVNQEAFGKAENYRAIYDGLTSEPAVQQGGDGSMSGAVPS